MDCPFVLDGEQTSACPEYCESCFFDDRKILHDHENFCRIDEQGRHAFAKRGFTVPRKQLVKEDFPVLDIQTLTQKECVVCSEDFSNENPPVARPGCFTKKHAEGVFNKDLGMIDSKQFYCMDCAMRTEIAKDRGSYCDISLYCDVCQFEQEIESWKEEFARQFAQAKDASSLASDLLQLHLQPWLQHLIKQELEEKQIMQGKMLKRGMYFALVVESLNVQRS
jgi:hypothetical protein